jgi:hypothetical protein
VLHRCAAAVGLCALLAIALFAPLSLGASPTGEAALTEPQMNTARNSHTASLLSDGSVLVVGGWDGYTLLSSAERYDPATQSWLFAPSLHEARAFRASSTVFLVRLARLLTSPLRNLISIFGSILTANMSSPRIAISR